MSGALIPTELLGLDGRTWGRTRGLSHVTRALIPLSYASFSRGVRIRTRTLRRWKPGGLPQARPLGVGVTGGTRTRAAGLTTPNAARYTTVTVASAGVEPAWRRRMKPAEPQAPLAVDRIRPAGFEPASLRRRRAVLVRAELRAFASGKGRSRTATAERRPGYSRLGSPVPGAFPWLSVWRSGTPGRARTCDLRVRSAALCSV